MIQILSLSLFWTISFFSQVLQQEQPCQQEAQPFLFFTKTPLKMSTQSSANSLSSPSTSGIHYKVSQPFLLFIENPSGVAYVQSYSKLQILQNILTVNGKLKQFYVTELKGLITLVNFRTCAICFMFNHPNTIVPQPNSCTYRYSSTYLSPY